MTPLSPTHRWLIKRIRVACIVTFALGAFLPPYIPKAALAQQDPSLATQKFLLVEDGFLKKTSPLTRQGARRAYAKGTIHTVKDGDSLERLSRWYPVSVETIRWANNLQAGTPIRPGDELLILPVDGILHTVSRGQTISRIAQLYDISMSNILNQNELKSEFIMAGQQLIIPGGRPIIEKQVQVVTVDEEPKDEEPGKPKPPTKKPVEVVVKPTAPFTPTPSAGVLQTPCASTCYYTQHYHAGHYAVDMQDKSGGNLGGPIYAAEEGTVIRADTGWNGGYGNVIEVDHGNGLVTLYGHNKELYVKEGDRVQRGQSIAWMGNTGLVYGATGIHVHFEVRVSGIKKNPRLYLE
ncbi:MAG: peptidoglycan DD-metalloendopeptidase family protein [Candidatus Peribacter sp.]|jgi:LysM repeat protein|nr:peptidoglycan DD-metalloendopeptidase family protein [Candidatus Peribacter sp.]MBT4393487.1 peptidoglycan DD-metalloendopeptidase family protein [Candidatus Peribacter sp.]MBT4600846.1 peptidoglycan DD-metalloendopeptidase family protein [Candidatus Peribacter sp.]MBT5149493.1 peptidoglycan DD-metalloendopeptidase family protein [Candidatus Peribacter sp.]MBT5637308.1 peptidoglycan DD-metalloendopeptidase family protein [Candidatus Peribacter sp.]